MGARRRASRPSQYVSPYARHLYADSATSCTLETLEDISHGRACGAADPGLLPNLGRKDSIDIGLVEEAPIDGGCCERCAGAPRSCRSSHGDTSTTKSTPGVLPIRSTMPLPWSDWRGPQQSRHGVGFPAVQMPARISRCEDRIGGETADRDVIRMLVGAVRIQRKNDDRLLASDEPHQRAPYFIGRRLVQLAVDIAKQMQLGSFR